MFTIYYKPECPYCKKALKFLDTNNVKYKKVNVYDYGGKQPVVLHLYNRKLIPSYENITVPIVFKYKKFIKGGSEELLRMKL
jgi:glutaredoxin